MEEKAQVVAHSTKRIKRSSPCFLFVINEIYSVLKCYHAVLLFRSGDDTNDESLLPPLPQTENECTKRKVSSRQMKHPLYREKLESQMENAVGEIEIIDGFIVRWMPESNRKFLISSIFSGRYDEWVDNQEGAFGVGNGGITLGNTTRAPDAAYYQPGNIPSSTEQMLTPTAHTPNLIVETEHEGRCGEAEQKITDFWLQNGVQEAWLLVIPDIVNVVPAAPVGGPPVPLPVVQMTQVRPIAPYIAIYIAGNNPPLLGYFPIDWHTEFQPPPQSILVGAPPINCDRFMKRLC
jgi:hypothetical protein